MIPQIKEINFGPGTENAYATLHQATVSLQDMGDRLINTQVKIDGDVVPSFDGWELEFNGERFILPVKEPQASKDISSRNSIVDLTFYSWAVYQMKRYYFMEMTSVGAGVSIADKYEASINLSVSDFVVLFNKVLDYYFGGKIRMDLYRSSQTEYSSEPVFFQISKMFIWEVLQKFFEIYGYRWSLDYDATQDIYYIKVNYPAEIIDDHDFMYGYEGGLTRFERQVQDYDVQNILLGRGGEKNLPFRYFKLADPNNTAWEEDPDAIPELANVYFENLRDANFRWYVRGWMHNPNRDTSGDEAWDPGHVFPTYSVIPAEYQDAYNKGATDTRFDPVEYVKDELSISKYGERWGMLDDNDEIYPTIQGVEVSGHRIDEVLAVSEIITDNVEEAATQSSEVYSIEGAHETQGVYPGPNTFVIRGKDFTVPAGLVVNVSIIGSYIGYATRVRRGPLPPGRGESIAISRDDPRQNLLFIDTQGSRLIIRRKSDDTEVSAVALTQGEYYYELSLRVVNSDDTYYTYFAGINGLRMVSATENPNAWKPTFDIWVGNIWGSSQGNLESDEDYSRRVWTKILGDRTGKEAKVVFSDGFMSISQDYEFVIADYPVVDRSRTKDGVLSEWKITMYKSDAEYKATGLYIPNSTTGGKPVAGDHFYFTGIDMPFMYVSLAEERVSESKTDALEETKDVKPTWVINLDKVRINTLEASDQGRLLIDRLSTGTMIRIRDKRFTDDQALALYVKSLTYTWSNLSKSDAGINPAIEVVLTDKVAAVMSPLQQVQGEISTIRSSYVKTADLEATIRAVTAPMFLKKTGETENSESPTHFAGLLSSKNFAQGEFGGTGWGHYIDPEGSSVLEVDKIVARQELRVNSLVTNQVSYEGGRQVISAASIECNRVIDDDSGYICYFDQKQGSLSNLFVVGDYALSQVFDPENVEIKYYKRRVTEVADSYIVLSKSDYDGLGVPEEGDIIVQYGHMSDPSRQYVIVRDVIGGGNERMLSGLNSASATGVEYYFAGKQNNGASRWFVGNAQGEHAEYINGTLNITGRISAQSVLQNSDGTWHTLSTYLDGIEDAIEEQSGDIADLDYLKRALLDGTTIIEGGLVLSSLIQLGSGTPFVVYSGINGVRDASKRGGGIAAWYGGPMVDHQASPAEVDYAKSLFRFDGSGYFAGGNISWNADGSGQIPGISWSNGRVVLDSNIYLSGGDQRVVQLADAVTRLLSWFEVDTYGDIHVLGDRGFYSDSFVSAGGRSNTQSGGSGLSVYTSSALGGTFSDTDDSVFNAYTVNALHGRIAALENSTPNVAWGTPGADYSPLTINGVTRNLLTSHQAIYPLTIKVAGTTRTIYNPSSAAANWNFVAGTGITLTGASGQVTIAIASGYATQTWVNTNFYTKTQVDNMVSAIPKFKVEVVQTLPAVGDSATVYLVPTQNEPQNLYTEYIYVDNAWEQLGTQGTDLTGYVNTLTNSGSGNYVTGITKSGNTLTVTYGTLPTTIALANVNDADDLKAIEALTGTTGLLKKTAADTWTLDTTAYLSSHQTVTLAPGTNDGTLKLTTAAGVVDNIAVKGLGTNAFNSTSYLPIAGGTVTGDLTVEGTTMLKAYLYDYTQHHDGVTAENTTFPTILGKSTSLDTSFHFFDTKFYSSVTNTSNRGQMAYGYTNNEVYYRHYYSGEWSDWVRMLHTGNYGTILNSVYARLGENNTFTGDNTFTGINNFTGSYSIFSGPIGTNGATMNEFLASRLTPSGGSVTGAIVIDLPGAWTHSMNTYEIIVFEYGGNGASRILVSGYNYGSTQRWVNARVAIDGSYNNGVRLGYDSATEHCCIILGTSETVWSWPQVYLSRVFQGKTTGTAWGTGYTISVKTSESTLSSLVTPDLPDAHFKTVTATTFSGNASTATKLATARSIWGQSFDGSADITGAMSGVTNIDSLLHLDTTNSRIGIAQSSPAYTLDVTGTLRATGAATLGSTLGVTGLATFGNNVRLSGHSLYFDSSHSKYAVYDTTVGGLHFNCGIYSDSWVSAGGVSTTSDINLKTDFVKVKLTVEDIAGAPAFDFAWKDGRGRSAGSIAQYWKKLLPNNVSTISGKYLAMEYGNIALLSAITIAKAVESQEAKIERLEKRVEELESQLLKQ